MSRYLVPAFVIAGVWVLLTNRPTLESFALGFVFGLIVAVASPRRLGPVRWRMLPDQTFALVVYTLILLRDILLSGIDVARRVLSPRMRLNPGIVAIDTGDPSHSALIAALSGDVITLTPGELVVEVEHGHILYVHCLDVVASAGGAAAMQKRRLGLFQRILGRTA
jgi:multicomponent Na+:H+ antiporter subunit E